MILKKITLEKHNRLIALKMLNYDRNVCPALGGDAPCKDESFAALLVKEVCFSSMSVYECSVCKWAVDLNDRPVKEAMSGQRLTTNITTVFEAT